MKHVFVLDYDQNDNNLVSNLVVPAETTTAPDLHWWLYVFPAQRKQTSVLGKKKSAYYYTNRRFDQMDFRAVKLKFTDEKLPELKPKRDNEELSYSFCIQMDLLSKNCKE